MAKKAIKRGKKMSSTKLNKKVQPLARVMRKAPVADGMPTRALTP